MTPRPYLQSLGLVALIAVVASASDAPPPSLTYRFEEVKSKVLRAPGGDTKREEKVVVGGTAEAGDVVTTGYWARAVVAVPERGSRFEIESSSRVKLAGNEPGVLLLLERGRLKAIFEAVTGTEPRIVATPGALLAVRGTRYGIEVDSSGNAALAVFEGKVEVTGRGVAPPAPLFVGPGELCMFGPRQPPRAEPMGPRGMNEKSWGMPKGGGREGSKDGGRPPDGGRPADGGGDPNRPGGKQPGGPPQQGGNPPPASGGGGRGH